MADAPAHGLFSWADLSAPDPQAAKSFYNAVFGWDGEDQTDPDGNYIYSLMSKGGNVVAGIGPLPQEQADAGYPPTWNSYINVDSVDDVTAKVEESGGTVMMAMDVMDSGRLAFFADPTGAVVGLWQAKNFKGAEAFNEHGAMTWNELATRDDVAARKFYSKILPWDFESLPGPQEYYVIQLGENQNGGVLPMDDTWPAEIPAHWMVYFNVDDADAIVSKITAAGGEIARDAFDTPAGRIVVIRDPQGAHFSVIAPSQAVTPPEA